MTTTTQPAELPALMPIDDYLPTDGPRWTTANFIACVGRYARDYARQAVYKAEERWRAKAAAGLPALSDERAEFEAHRAQRTGRRPGCVYDGGKHLDPLPVHPLPGRYINDTDNEAWHAWQARAALAATGAQAQADQAPAEAHGALKDAAHAAIRVLEDTMLRSQTKDVETRRRAAWTKLNQTLANLEANVQPKNTPLAAQAAPAVPAHLLVKEWAKQNYVDFVSRSDGLRSTETISFAALERLAAAPTPAAQAPEGWLFICKKPGKIERYLDLCESGSCGWPWDEWATVERIALVGSGANVVVWDAAPQPTKEQQP